MRFSKSLLLSEYFCSKHSSDYSKLTKLPLQEINIKKERKKRGGKGRKKGGDGRADIEAKSGIKNSERKNILRTKDKTDIIYRTSWSEHLKDFDGDYQGRR